MPDDKQPGLSWSAPKSSTPAAPAPATEPEVPPVADLGSRLGFPSSKKIAPTQAPLYAALLVGGIIAGVLFATYWTPASQGEVPSIATSNATSTAASTSAPTQKTTTPTEAAVVVVDQSAGPSVSISKLNIARPVWVVVYVSREGKPGNALGARLFMATDKRGTVGLLRNTQAGQSYFVGLSVDDGDRKFSLSKDKPLADADGGPLWATFRAL